MTRVRWTALALALLAAAVYANTVANGFALDDRFIIQDNPRVHGIERLPEAVTSPYWPGTPDRIALYRPVTTATYAVEWELWGDNPLPFHVTNLLLHALVTALVFLLLHPLVGRTGALAGGAVFAVHPVHVEAVANVVGRAELLAAVWVLAALLLYLRTDPTAGRRRVWAGAAGVAVAYFLGLGSKEIAVTLPGLLLVVEAGRGWGGGRGGPDGAGGTAPGGTGEEPGSSAAGAGFVRRLVARWPVYALAGVALGAYLAVRGAVLGTAVGNDVAGFLSPLGEVQRILTAVAVWPEYARLLFFPLHLVADYSPGVLLPVDGIDGRVGAGVLVGVAAGLAVVGAWSRARSISLGILWFVVAVVPVSNLVIPIGVLLAERTLYLPSVGLALAVGGVWAWLEHRRPVWPERLVWRRVAGVALLVVLVLGAARTWTRTPTWRSTDTVMATLAEDHPESFRVQWLLGERLWAAGRAEEALPSYRRAVELAPGHFQLRMQFGQALLAAGRLDSAIANFRTARGIVPELPEAHAFLMAALLRAGRADEAVTAGREALQWVDHRGIHHQLAVALAASGDFAAALDARQRSLQLAGARAAPRQRVHEAELLLRLGRPADAEAALASARGQGQDPRIPSLEALQQAIETADTAVLPYR